MAVSPCLIINPGSTSRKYAMALRGKVIVRGHFELQAGKGVVTYFSGANAEERTFLKSRFHETLKLFVDELVRGGHIDDPTEIGSVSLRIVAPGKSFAKHQRIDAAFTRKFLAEAEDAPLHIGPALDELGRAKAILPKAAVYGISDSAFHATMPEYARRYAFATADAKRYDLHRYGYHGISVGSVVRRAPKLLGKRPSRLIVCHLGGGASVTAVKNGRSIDTSMGLTPLEGLAMASRIGDVDAGALIRLGKAKGLSYEQLEHYLNTQSGLAGLAGTGDMHELLQRYAAGDAVARAAIELYVYRVAKYIGAYTAALGGLDAIIFSATIGERADRLRALICRQLSGLGVRLDAAANRRASHVDGIITTPRSRPTVTVIRTDELAEMARQAYRLQVAERK